MKLEFLKKRLVLYLEAEAAILSGQSYSLEGLSLTRANLDSVRKQIASLDAMIEAEEAKQSGKARARLRYVVPVDGVKRCRIKKL